MRNTILNSFDKKWDTCARKEMDLAFGQKFKHTKEVNSIIGPIACLQGYIY